MPAAGNPALHAGPDELLNRTADLADAEARYHATLDEPAAGEGDRIEAVDNLDRAQTLMRELTCSLPMAEAEPEADLF